MGSLVGLRLASLMILAATPALAGPPAEAKPPTHPAPDARTFIALAMADGPTAAQRLVLSFRAPTASAAIADAVRACYTQAAPGYMHTCHVWYGSAWIVGTTCRQSASSVAFGIGDDPNSPEAARDKAIRAVRDVEHADVSDCTVTAEYNADDMTVARSVATGTR